jgi:hypothetical protein
MNHIASRGTIFGRSFVAVRDFFYHESYCDESVIMTIYGFLKILYFFTSDERGGAMPLYGKWVCLWPYMGTPQRRGFFGCIKLSTPYYSYIPNLCLKLSGYIYS